LVFIIEHNVRGESKGGREEVERERIYNSLLLILIRLVEEEVGSELLVLVAGEVGLDDGVAGEAETAQLIVG
jgi:hypothetical protein